MNMCEQVSFICCYTDSKLLDDLQQSVSCFQSFQIEWVLIDNSKGQYASAASALNAGAHISTKDILVFLHQDIEFEAEKTLELICREAKKGKIVGVAGRKSNGGPLVSTIIDGLNKERHHPYSFRSECEEVMTCDECLIGMSRETFNRVNGFDEKAFDGWHFYGVDLCLRTRKNGIRSCVVPSELWHKSRGNRDNDKNWLFYEKRLRSIYSKDYQVIYYPCGRCYANLFLFGIWKLFLKVRKRIRRIKKKLIKA